MIEAPKLAGRIVCVSLLAPTAPISVTLAASGGGSGSISGVIPASAGVSSIALTVPAAATAHLAMTLTGPGSFSEPQLETGSVPTPFERRLRGVEVELCQRYFEKSQNLTVTPGAFAINGGQAFGDAHALGDFRKLVTFRMRKRAAPTIQVYASNGAAGAITFYHGAWRNDGALSVIQPVPSEQGFYCGHNLTNAVETQFAWTAEAEL